MKTINIPGDKDTPSVFIDDDNLIFRVVGPSFSENPYSTYSNILKWLDESVPDLQGEIICEFYYSYLNSASKKILYEIFTKMEDYNADGKNFVIEWSYDEYDEDMLELGHEFAELIDLPFEYRPKKG